MAAELSRTRAEQLGEVESERATAMALLADEKADLEAKIARLRDIEAEQRSQMRHPPHRTALAARRTLRHEAALPRQARDVRWRPRRMRPSYPLSPVTLRSESLVRLVRGHRILRQTQPCWHCTQTARPGVKT